MTYGRQLIAHQQITTRVAFIESDAHLLIYLFANGENVCRARKHMYNIYVALFGQPRTRNIYRAAELCAEYLNLSAQNRHKLFLTLRRKNKSNGRALKCLLIYSLTYMFAKTFNAE